MSTFLYINRPFGYFLCEISCPFSFSLSVFFSFVGIVYFVDTSPLNFFRLCHIAYHILLPDRRLNLRPWQWNLELELLGCQGLLPLLILCCKHRFLLCLLVFLGFSFLVFTPLIVFF